MADLTVSVLASSPAGPFKTIASGAQGSGRLLDVTLAQIASLIVLNSPIVFVNSVLDFFRWDATSTLTADNITVCNPTANGSNAGRFVRMLIPALEWQLQAAYTIDSTSADDEGAVTLKTYAEWLRRTGNGKLLANQTIIITGIGTTDTLDTSQVALNTGTFTLTINGTSTVSVSAQTGTTYTPRVVATNTPNQIANSNTSFVWTPYIGGGYYVKYTNGGANGLYAVVVKDLGSGVARVSTFLNSSGTETQPSSGNTFQIELMPTVTLSRLSSSPNITITNLNFAGSVAHRIFTGADYITSLTAIGTGGFINCTFTVLRLIGGGIVNLANCVIMNATSGAIQSGFFSSYSPNWLGGALFDSANARYICSGRALFRRGCLFQGTSIQLFGGSGATASVYVTFQDTGFFDTVSGAIDIREGAAAQAQTLWGDTGASNPFCVTLDRSSHLYLLTALQTLTNGGANEIAMPVTANTTFASARSALGVKDSSTISDASIMVVT